MLRRIRFGPASIVCVVALSACGQGREVANGIDAGWCTHCHGGADDSSGAPPYDLDGQSDTSLRSVGAHTTHVRALGGVSSCTQCHPDPRAGSTEHLNGRVDVAFGTFATAGGANASRFDPDALSCSAVYCHGAFVGGNAGNAPVWTSVGVGQAACGTCHGLPPATTHAGLAGDLTGCGGCHSTTVDSSGNLIEGGDHINGRVDGHHDAAWMDTGEPSRFHGTWAKFGLAPCQACHGESLDGGTAGVACADCHGSGQSSCASCHPDIPFSGQLRSTHFAGVADPSSNCQTCHDVQGITGHDQLALEALTPPDASCKACHAGQGRTLGGQTPPLLVGWTDTVAGDFHGERAGTGYGGTLKAPYVRGQPPLACLACHDQHASGNAFLFAVTVNDTPIAAGAIDRAGVGGEALCNACHEGERHATCATVDCHGVDPEPPGSPCFWCHGHEGIRFWTAPNPTMVGTVGCEHCHSFSQPATEYAAPTFSQLPTASSITATTATVRWMTNEVATSYVEYGVGTAGYVAGNAAMATSHVVTLTGLQPSTSYVWRIRSSDPFRSVTETALGTFTTFAADAVPSPDLGSVGVYAQVPSTTTATTLRWYPVTAPSGTAVEYEVQLSSDPGFTSAPNATLGVVDTSLATANSGWISGTPTQDSSYPPRPELGFDVTLTNLPQDDCVSVRPNVYFFRVRARDGFGKVSDWSATGTFGAMATDPNCGYF